jgi:hypothetical protein
MTTMRSLLRRSSLTPRFCVPAWAFHRLWASDGLLFPYRIGEELPTKRPLCETWPRMSHPDPNGPPDRRPIKVGEVWENPGDPGASLGRPC